MLQPHLLDEPLEGLKGHLGISVIYRCLDKPWTFMFEASLGAIPYRIAAQLKTDSIFFVKSFTPRLCFGGLRYPSAAIRSFLPQAQARPPG
jgi:hypothetical protein